MLKTLGLPKVEYITSTEGKLKAVVLSLEDWKRITETLKIMSSKELMQSIRCAKKQLRSNTNLLSLKEVMENL
jgi:PHD/YefM family antitoxin component YafN of YafNO toxin-antitoxin module